MNALPVLARLTETDDDSPASAPKRNERLRELARWIDLLAEELEALELGDFPGMRAVAQKRGAVEAEIRKRNELEEGPAFHEIYAQAVAEAVQRLDEWTERERLTRDELTQLHDGSLNLVRSMPKQSGGGRYPVLDETGSQLNVSL